ncbi:Plasmodium exported protein (Pm-fam-a like), unknown function, partial [Plasmodium malariae]
RLTYDNSKFIIKLDVRLCRMMAAHKKEKHSNIKCIKKKMKNNREYKNEESSNNKTAITVKNRKLDKIYYKNLVSYMANADFKYLRKSMKKKVFQICVLASFHILLGILLIVLEKLNYLNVLKLFDPLHLSTLGFVIFMYIRLTYDNSKFIIKLDVRLCRMMAAHKKEKHSNIKCIKKKMKNNREYKNEESSNNKTAITVKNRKLDKIYYKNLVSYMANADFKYLRKSMKKKVFQICVLASFHILLGILLIVLEKLNYLNVLKLFDPLHLSTLGFVIFMYIVILSMFYFYKKFQTYIKLTRIKDDIYNTAYPSFRQVGFYKD